MSWAMIAGGGIVAAGAIGGSMISSNSASKGQGKQLNLQRDLAPFQTQAFLSQQGLYNSQKKLLDIFSGGYKDLVPKLSSILQNKIQGNNLPADLARNIGQYYNQAGSKLGNYFASRGMMNSGASQQAYQQLTQEEAAKKLATILGEQRQGISESLSFMGGQPTVQPYGTSSLPQVLPTQQTQSTPMDLSSLGSIFARGFKGPTASAYGGNLSNAGAFGSSPGATTAFGQYNA